MEIQNDAKTFDFKKSNHIFHVEYKLKCLRIETNVTSESKSDAEEEGSEGQWKNSTEQEK